MEPPLRIRILGLDRLQPAKDWYRPRQPDKERVSIARRRRDSPQDLEDEQAADADGSSSKSLRTRRKPSRAAIEQQRRQFLQLMLATSTTPTSLDSPAVYRESLFGGFVNDLTWIQIMPSRHLVLQQLRSYFDSGQNEGPMAAATEALLLAQLSATIRDAEYLTAARRRYGLAMSRCARKLAAKSNKLSDWTEALAAIQALGTCEMYDDLSQGDEVWIQHSDGMLAILQQLSIQPEDLVNGYLKMVIYNAVDTSLKTAIWARRPPVFAEQHWLDLISSSCEGRGWCLQHIVCRLPTLLCLMDELSPEGPVEAVDILKELLAIERDLLRWLHQWYLSYQDTPIRTRSVHDFPDFVHQHKDFISIFPTVYDFPSPLEAHGHLIYYDWLNIVRQAICDLHSRSECYHLISSDDRDRALHNATESANAACMLAPYSSQMERTEPSKALLQILGLAEDWYVKTEQREKLRFVRCIVGDEEKHQQDHKLLVWQDVNGFLVRRVLLQHCVGPRGCVLKERKVVED